MRLGWVRTLFFLFALTVQSFAVTTHVHVASSTSQQQRSGDPADCPVCQALHTAGQVILPDVVPVAIPQPTGFISYEAPAVLASAFDIPSHHWQSRGPPRV